MAYVTVYGSAGGASLEWGGTAEEPWRTMEVWTEIDGVAATLHPTIPPDGQHRASVADFLAAVRGGDFAQHVGEDALTRARGGRRVLRLGRAGSRGHLDLNWRLRDLSLNCHISHSFFFCHSGVLCLT